MQDIKDSRLFTCGSSLFPPTSELNSAIVVSKIVLVGGLCQLQGSLANY